jgi:Helix-turn-helix domain
VEDDRTGDERRTTVSEAAEILGISAEAVRGRIRRGTIPVEREGGTVYVLIEGLEEYRTTADQSRTTADQPGDRTDLLIAELQDRVRSLEQANRENRRIIAALTSRIPAIEAPPEVRESPATEAKEPERAEPHPAAGGAQEGVQRPWRSLWRRVFGG